MACQVKGGAHIGGRFTACLEPDVGSVGRCCGHRPAGSDAVSAGAAPGGSGRRVDDQRTVVTGVNAAILGQRRVREGKTNPAGRPRTAWARLLTLGEACDWPLLNGLTRNLRGRIPVSSRWTSDTRFLSPRPKVGFRVLLKVRHLTSLRWCELSSRAKPP